MRMTKLFPVPLLILLSSPVLSNPESDGTPNVLAKRGEGVVTHEMFDARVARIPEASRQNVLRDRGRLESLLKDLLLKTQLTAAAREAGLDQDPEIIARMQLAAEEELANAWLEKYPTMQPEGDYEAMAREFFQVNPHRFQTELSLNLTHILVGTETRDETEARALADELRARLDEHPREFNRLVQLHSDDPSAKSNQGRFANVRKGQMVKAFENVAFNLEQGQISMPVRTQYGFHIIRLDKINQPRDKSYDEARESLVLRMRKQHKERVQSNYLSSLTTMETELKQEDLEEMVRRHFGDEVVGIASPEAGSE